MKNDLPDVVEEKRFASPAPAPQALAFFAGSLWMGSRDERRLYQLDPKNGKVLEALDPPGIPWAAVSTGRSIRFTIGQGAEDDRYIIEYKPGTAFAANGDGQSSAVGSDGLPARITCPDFTGSYLSWDGQRLYLSQWYKHRILELAPDGGIKRAIDIGAEVSGHTFVNGEIFVLRGTEQDGEHWHIAKFNPAEEKPSITDVARVPFACRSLTFDGRSFWSNHRAANMIISFSLP